MDDPKMFESFFVPLNTKLLGFIMQLHSDHKPIFY